MRTQFIRQSVCEGGVEPRREKMILKKVRKVERRQIEEQDLVTRCTTMSLLRKHNTFDMYQQIEYQECINVYICL